jgi:hypothetical protein
MLSNRQYLERRFAMWRLGVLKEEVARRRAQLIEDLRAARSDGDLGRYCMLLQQWRRHPRLYGTAPPPT